jgi:hypothetical protein
LNFANIFQLSINRQNVRKTLITFANSKRISNLAAENPYKQLISHEKVPIHYNSPGNLYALNSGTNGQEIHAQSHRRLKGKHGGVPP